MKNILTKESFEKALKDINDTPDIQQNKIIHPNLLPYQKRILRKKAIICPFCGLDWEDCEWMTYK